MTVGVLGRWLGARAGRRGPAGNGRGAAGSGAPSSRARAAAAAAPHLLERRELVGALQVGRRRRERGRHLGGELRSHLLAANGGAAAAADDGSGAGRVAGAVRGAAAGAAARRRTAVGGEAAARGAHRGAAARAGAGSGAQEGLAGARAPPRRCAALSRGRRQAPAACLLASSAARKALLVRALLARNARRDPCRARSLAGYCLSLETSNVNIRRRNGPTGTLQPGGPSLMVAEGAESPSLGL